MIGEGFGEKPKVEISRLPDGAAGHPTASDPLPTEAFVDVDAVQASDQGLKFTVPTTIQAGIFAYRISTDTGSCYGVLNRPKTWWALGDLGMAASPGGWIRIFGRNLGGKKAILRLEGELRRIDLPAQGDVFAVSVEIPADLPLGNYRIFAHNGFGGQRGWSEPLRIEVAKPTPWPTTVFNVRDSGAEGDGLKDDTAAILTALQKAEKAGGRRGLFPSGTLPAIRCTADPPVDRATG